MFRIDDIDTCLSTEAFKYLLQAPLVIVPLVRTEGPVSTSGEVYDLLGITRSCLIGQLVVISLRCSRWEVWCLAGQVMRFPSNLSKSLPRNDSTGYTAQGNAQTRTSQGLIKVVIKGFCQTWCRWINAAHRQSNLRCIDGQWAEAFTHGASRASIHTKVLISLAEFFCQFVFTRFFQTFCFTEDCNPLTRGQGEVTGWTSLFTEATFHTDCEFFIDWGLSLKILTINVRIIGNHNIWIQEALRVKESLNATVDSIGFFTPFYFDKWCYHAACTMFCLTGSTITRNAFRHFFYKVTKVFGILRIGEVWCNVKVNITGEGMAKDDTAIHEVILMEEFGNHSDTLSEIFDWEAYVFGDNRRTQAALTRSDWEETLTDSPPRVIFIWILGVQGWASCTNAI